MASAVIREKEKERMRQRESLSAVAAERDIVAAQLAELSAQFNQHLSDESKVKPLREEKESVEEVEKEEKGIESESESDSESDSDSMLDMAAQQELMMQRIIADR